MNTQTIAQRAAALDIDVNLYVDAVNQVAGSGMDCQIPASRTLISDEAATAAESLLDLVDDFGTIALEELAGAATDVADAEATLAEAREARDEAIRAARRAGVTVAAIMAAGGVARQTVYDAL